MLPRPSFPLIVAASILLRVGLILYSEWHDAHSSVKYTDVDYRVFTDASRFIMNTTHGPYAATGVMQTWGWVSIGNPYERATYRYTPLLALLLTPNIWLHPSFGKYLFATCDIVVGALIYRMLLSSTLGSASAKRRRIGKDGPGAGALAGEARKEQERLATLYASLHLLNPMVFSISTRGSSESILGILVVSMLYFATKRRWNWTAVLLGFATHWKIYPVVYAASCVMALSRDGQRRKSKGHQFGILSLVNAKSFRFALLSGGTFMCLNVIMYLIWGYPFLYETYLYHLHRLDHRHNFSPYFYPIYLSLGSSPSTTLPLWKIALHSPLVSFLPQITLSLGTGFLFGRRVEDLPFAWFVQTAVFVTFNKVCTSQYFLWYLTLLPLLLQSLSISRTRAALMVAVWVGTQALWLKTAYDLEFLGKNVYFGLWVRSVVFLLGNVWVLGEVIRGYRSAGERRKEIKRD